MWAWMDEFQKLHILVDVQSSNEIFRCFSCVHKLCATRKIFWKNEYKYITLYVYMYVYIFMQLVKCTEK